MSLTEIARTGPPTRGCGIKRLKHNIEFESLEGSIDILGELVALDRILKDPTWKTGPLLKALQSEGYGEFVSERILERHRTGTCSC